MNSISYEMDIYLLSLNLSFLISSTILTKYYCYKE